MTKCIDISNYQGVIDTSTFKGMKRDIPWVIIRCSYTHRGEFVQDKDKSFEKNIENAYAAGMKIGVYHYSQALSIKEAETEAAYVLKIIKKHKAKISLPVVIDYEFGKRLNASKAKKIGKNGCYAICSAFCEKVKAAGYTPMVYANLNTLNNYISTELPSKYKVWVAQYPYKDRQVSDAPVSELDYKKPYYLWQFTSSGRVPGVGGKVDLSKTKPTAAAYTGALPDFTLHTGDLIAQKAKELAYAFGTPRATYTYPTGKPKEAYKKAISKVYDTSKWGKQTKAGASCDVFVGTTIRASGYDKKYPRGIDEDFKYLPKSALWKKTGKSKIADFRPGDVILYDTHTLIYIGNGYGCEAGYKSKRYGCTVKESDYKPSKYPGFGVWRATKPIRNWLQKGDTGTQVKRMQKFLIWAGYSCGKAGADGVFGKDSDSAVRKFQKANGLTVDGGWGPKCNDKAKTIKR